jgi:hypothetical protein
MFTTPLPSTVTTLSACTPLMIQRRLMQGSMTFGRTRLVRRQTRGSTQLLRSHMRQGAHSARTHAARVRDAEECGAAFAADMPRITRARTHAVEASPFTDSGEQTQVQEMEPAKAPPQHLSLKDHKHFKHGRDVPPEARLQYL